MIGLSVIEHVEVSNEERAAYLRIANAKRRGNGNGNGNGNGDEDAEPAVDAEEPVADVQLDEARVQQLAEAEEFLLTVTDVGFGKRSSAYEYRVTGRGGQGIANITVDAGVMAPRWPPASRCGPATM